MLKITDNSNFNLLEAIRGKVESMANKFTNYVSNTSPNDFEIGLVITYVESYLSQCEAICYVHTVQ
jgi:hypothetical protein